MDLPQCVLCRTTVETNKRFVPSTSAVDRDLRVSSGERDLRKHSQYKRSGDMSSDNLVFRIFSPGPAQEKEKRDP